MKSRPAFTLVELLVVVAIIALLVALILPTLSRAREQAKIARCSSNLRSIAQALASYALQNKDLMPAVPTADDNPALPPNIPTFNNGLEFGWADALYIDGDFGERTDVGGIGGAQGEFTGVNNGASWQYPSWGYGMMQCPDHSSDTQLDSNGIPSDKRVQQGYALAWCAASGFYTKVSLNPLVYNRFSVHFHALNPAHIMVAEGSAAFGSAYPVPAHMNSTAKNQGYQQYGVFERHLLNTKYAANYLFADSHVEISSDYGWAPSPLDFRSPRTWTIANYEGPSTNPNALNHIWEHGND